MERQGRWEGSKWMKGEKACGKRERGGMDVGCYELGKEWEEGGRGTNRGKGGGKRGGGWEEDWGGSWRGDTIAPCSTICA